MKQLFIGFLLCALMSGCATTAYAPNAAEVADAATVYFIRERAEPTAWNLWIYVDEAKLASLADNSHVVVKVKPGKRALALKWPPLAGQKDLKETLSIEPNTTAYYVIAADFSNIRPLGGVLVSDRSMGIAAVTKEEADRVIGQLKH